MTRSQNSVISSWLGTAAATFSLLTASVNLQAFEAEAYAPGSARSQDYQYVPPYLDKGTGKPSIVFAFDVSGSMWIPAYPPTGNWKTSVGRDFDENKNYFGYFDSATLDASGNRTPARYDYDSANQWFYASDTGEWDGDFLNWLTMRRVDVARQVMIGGKVKLGGTTADGTQLAGRPGTNYNGETVWVLESDVEYRDNDNFSKSSANLSAYSPFPDNTVLNINKGEILSSAGAASSAIKLSDKLEIGYADIALNYANATERAQAISDWVNVRFQNTYTDPVVVASTVTFNGSDPAVARTTNVSIADQSFMLGMQEWDSADGNHTQEQVFYMVAERGQHELILQNGSTLSFEAGSINTRDTLYKGEDVSSPSNSDPVSFVTPFSSAPVLFTGVSTLNNSGRTLGARARFVYNNQARVTLTEQDGSSATLASTETLNYIAIPGGSFQTRSGSTIEVGDIVSLNDDQEPLNFSSSFSDAPKLMFAIQSTNDTRAAGVRVSRDWTKDRALVLIEGNQKDSNASGTSGTTHSGERVGYIAAETNSDYKIRVKTTRPPSGLVQRNNTLVNFGLSVFNFDHTQPTITNIIDGKGTDGQTMYPCYFIYDDERWAARKALAAADPAQELVTMQLTNGGSREYICTPTGVHSPNDRIVQVIEEYPLIWSTTPIAENLIDIGRYVKQEAAIFAGSGNETDARFRDLPRNNNYDPYYDPEVGATLPCKTVYSLHFNDGEPFADLEDYSPTTRPFRINTDATLDITSDFKPDIVVNGMTGRVNPFNPSANAASEMVDNVAYALRSDCRADLPGVQEVVSYYVYADLGADEENLPATDDSIRKMMEAAVLGGFRDNQAPGEAGYGVPDNYPFADNGLYDYYRDKANCVVSEWDADADCAPDNFFLATSGDQIASKIQEALNAIVARESSGGAASVVSSTIDGDGAVYLSSFVPKATDSDDGVKPLAWYGDVYAIFIDTDGYFRDDTNSNKTLDDSDKYVFTCFSPATNTVRVKLQDAVDETTPAPGLTDYDADSDGVTDCGGFPTTGSFNTVWNASAWLSDLTSENAVDQRGYATADDKRYIKTWIDLDADGVVDYDSEYLDFTSELADGSEDTWRMFNLNSNRDLFQEAAAGGSDSKVDLVQWLIDWTRGDERLASAGGGAEVLRSRTRDSAVQRLGDIINGTPTVVGRPAENLDLIYSDTSYGEFLERYRDRRTMVYAAANDGMIHAFNGGHYDKTTREFLSRKSATGFNNWKLGQEVWAYVPFNALPHLRYLAAATYGGRDGNHIPVVDLKPRVFDAKIFGAGGVAGQTGADHPGGWGTVMVVGMGLGGGSVTIETDPDDEAKTTTFRSSFSIFDITDPEIAPRLLKEFSDPNLGFAMHQPAVIRTGDASTENWYLLFGSGANNTKTGLKTVSSETTAKLFTLNLKTLGVEETNLAAETNSFIGQILTIDQSENGFEDAAYFGTNKVTARDGDGTPTSFGGKLLRLNISNLTPSNWTVSTIVDAGRPISQRPTFGVDDAGSGWVLFGTGRFFTTTDSVDNTEQYMFGIKDTVTVAQIPFADLVDVTAATIEQSTGIIKSGVSAPGIVLDSSTVGDLESYQVGESGKGWYRRLLDNELSGVGGHRYMAEAALLFNTVTYLSYNPDDNVCKPDGNSKLWAYRFTTGTPWYESAFGVSKTAATKQISLGQVDVGDTPAAGLSLQSSLKALQEGRATAIAQKADTSFIRVEEDNLDGDRAGETSWREY